jgi:hypothetical protein
MQRSHAMPDIEPRPIPSSLEPAQSRGLTMSGLIGRVVTDLTPFQTYVVARQISRGRMKAAVELARFENRGLLAEAEAITKAKVRSTEEQIERLLHAERLDCLAESALKHEEASRIVDLVKDEVAHSLFKDALNGASARYASGVIRRSGGSGS